MSDVIGVAEVEVRARLDRLDAGLEDDADQVFHPGTADTGL